jgi:hypothetical protein
MTLPINAKLPIPMLSQVEALRNLSILYDIYDISLFMVYREKILIDYYIRKTLLS